jgi:UDP-N-acetylglucosamine--N-acetylmuramyl-(pentapeptide) pyrophosphoryl-undecaprenol N-acetylglucosamine transferase
MKFLFACAGTAGHINPALAIAGEIRRTIKNSEILFVGSGRRLENRLIPLEGYEIENIRISGFERGLRPKQIAWNLRVMKNLAVAARQSEEIIRRFQPDAVIGTGGYVCYPVLKKAAAMGIPTLIHESNAVPGLATKMLADKVDKILVAFPEAVGQYKHADKVTVTGTPVRGDFSATRRNEARRKLGLDGRPLVVSFWGSLGAEMMNEIMIEFITLNMESRLFNHIHATGGSAHVLSAMTARLRERTGNANIPRWIDIRSYIDDMSNVMAAADLVLCRSGASTIAELTVMGKPAVLVPSPNVTNNHQDKNANQLKRLGGAVVVTEKDCTGESLYKTVERLVKDKKTLTAMSEALRSAAMPDSAKKIVELIISIC